MHNDKHVIKMILESAQLLSTAHRVLDGTESIVKSKTNRNVKRWVLPDDRDTILYSATHMNHPSAIWCRQSLLNYKWLHSLLVELCAEYTYRYGKVHKCKQTGLVDALSEPPLQSPHKPYTEPPQAMPDECKVPGNSVAAYRSYYIMNKAHLATWKIRNKPEWYNA